MREDEVHTQESLFQKIVLDKVEKAFELIDKAMIKPRIYYQENVNLRREGYKIIDKILNSNDFFSLSTSDQIKILERYQTIASKLIDEGMNHHPEDFSKKLRVEGYDRLNKIQWFIEKQIKEGIKRQTDPTEKVSFKLRLKYQEKQYLRLMESFRILWRIDRMCDQNVGTEEILEQINLLKGYAEDSEEFIKHVDKFSRFMKQEQLDYLDDKYRQKTKGFCENLIDVWIAEFLNTGELKEVDFNSS